MVKNEKKKNQQAMETGEQDIKIMKLSDMDF